MITHSGLLGDINLNSLLLAKNSKRCKLPYEVIVLLERLLVELVYNVL